MKSMKNWREQEIQILHNYKYILYCLQAFMKVYKAKASNKLRYYGFAIRLDKPGYIHHILIWKFLEEQIMNISFEVIIGFW